MPQLISLRSCDLLQGQKPFYALRPEDRVCMWKDATYKEKVLDLVVGRDQIIRVDILENVRPDYLKIRVFFKDETIDGLIRCDLFPLVIMHASELYDGRYNKAQLAEEDDGRPNKER